MTGQDFAAALRQIADWYEAHPDVPTASYVDVVSVKDSREEADRLARALGSAKKDFSGNVFILARDFGGVSLRFLFWRAAVCTRRVIGSRSIPAQPATPEREEEIVVWDCGPILDHGQGGEAREDLL